MFKTTDGGSVWNQIDSYFDNGYVLTFDPNNQNVLFAAGSFYDGTNAVMSVCKSSNSGVSWNRTQLSTDRGAVYTLVINPTDSNHILAGGYYYDGTNYLGKIFKSTDGGDHWSDASSGIESRYNDVYALAFHSTSPNSVYAGCDNGIFRSTNGGSSWTNLNTGFYNVCAIVFNMDSPNVLYTATGYDGIYTSTDGGQTWSPMNDGLTTLEIECLALDPINKILYAGTSGGGLFSYDISTGVTPDPEPKLPAQFALQPNFPNPFNAETTIRYDVPMKNTGHISLTIYNISGQMVKMLVNEYQAPGQYILNWDGSDEAGRPVSSGIYLCKLQASNFQDVRKMMLIR